METGLLLPRHLSTRPMKYVDPTGHNEEDVTNGELVLGDEDYLARIQDIVDTDGALAAFKAMMADVRKYGSQLDDFNSENVANFNKLVSSLVKEIGSVDEEMHYFRNELNRAPSSLEEMYEMNEKLPPEKRWVLQPAQKSGYHMYGEDGVYNTKFLSSDGYFEAVYNRDGELLTEENDPVNMGTYNYDGIDMGAHTIYDVNPYTEHGNTSKVKSKGLLEHPNAFANYAIHSATLPAVSHYYEVFRKSNPDRFKKVYDYYSSVY